MMPCAVADKPDVDPFCGAGVKGMTRQEEDMGAGDLFRSRLQ